MSDMNKMLEREAGGFTIVKKQNTRELVDKAYADSENIAWNTLKERRDGTLHWSGIPNTSAITDETIEDRVGSRRKDYCAKEGPKGDLKKENRTIVPTKPHRPIGQQDKENDPP